MTTTSPSTVRASVGRAGRGLLLLFGIVVFVVGLLAVFVPQVERLLPVAAAVAALGSDYVVVAVVGVAAVALSVLLVTVQTVEGTDEATPPVVEAVESAPHPGRAFDRSHRGLAGVTSTDAARARLHDLAVETVMREEGCTRSTAERRIAERSWTDDPVAAAFVVGDGGGPGYLLRSILGVDDRIRRTAAAIERAAADGNGGSVGSDVDVGEGDDRPDAGPAADAGEGR